MSPLYQHMVIGAIIGNIIGLIMIYTINRNTTWLK